MNPYESHEPTKSESWHHFGAAMIHAMLQMIANSQALGEELTDVRGQALNHHGAVSLLVDDMCFQR